MKTKNTVEDVGKLQNYLGWNKQSITLVEKQKNYKPNSHIDSQMWVVSVSSILIHLLTTYRVSLLFTSSVIVHSFFLASSSILFNTASLATSL